MACSPKISIVIPVYNGSNYLSEAIDSALNQTCPDFEVIVVNDGSNDDGKTEAICKSYGERIRYFYKENGGVATAVNLGIRQMQSEWFAWLSHDDLFSTNRVDANLRTIKAHPEARVIFCRHRFFDSNGQILVESRFNFSKIENLGELLAINPIHFCAMTIHRACFDKVGFFNEDNRTTQDKEMQIRLARWFPFYLDNLSLTLARDHNERGTQTLTRQHQKDKDWLSHYFYNEFSLQDFLPNRNLKIKNESLLMEIATWLMLAKVVDRWGSKQIKRRYLYKALKGQARLIRQVIINYLGILFGLDFPMMNFFTTSILKFYGKVTKKKGLL
jgi:glycosyltransferase involved in cell wall biosynthesis